MQMLVLIVAALMLSSCNEPSQNESRINMIEKCDSYVQFKFKSPEKFVWVCSTGRPSTLKGVNIREYSYKGMTAYEVGEFGEIVFPPSKFKKTGNEIYINEIPMGKFMNAIVTADGKVLMGHFIRTFD
jgi:hypothetical protein